MASAEYMRAYRAANPEKISKIERRRRSTAKRQAYMRAYREAKKEEIAENQSRDLRVSGMYMGKVGLTRKQRQKFQKELEENGKT